MSEEVDLVARIAVLVCLVDKLDEYIKLGGEELDELAPIGLNHGWESSRYDTGVRLHKELATLRVKAGLTKATGFDLVRKVQDAGIATKKNALQFSGPEKETA